MSEDGEALLDRVVLCTWLSTAAAALAEHRPELDRLNVFPVPDSDTGTNLHLTVTEAARACAEHAGGGLDALGRAVARGALTGARGSSGVIVGEYLGVLVRALLGGDRPVRSAREAVLGAPEAVRVAPEAMAAALDRAARAAYASVARPVEGTVLTIARCVASGAAWAAAPVGEAAGAGRPGAADGGLPTAVTVLRSGVAAGYGALPGTTAQLPVLRAAGVLDAGAWGLLIVLDGLVEALGGAPAHRGGVPVVDVASAGTPKGTAGAHADADHDEDRVPDQGPDQGPDLGPDHGSHGDQVHHEVEGHPHDHAAGAFEVMYLVEAPSAGAPSAGAPSADAPPADGPDRVAESLRLGLGGIGESVAVVGGEGLWQVHVHTDHPREALSVARTIAGGPTQVRVRHLAVRRREEGTRHELGLVAVTTAPGLVADLAAAGAVVVLVPSGQGPGPELERALEDAVADHVVVVAAPALVGHRFSDAVTVLDGLSEVAVAAAAATFASLAPGGDPRPVVDEVRAATGVRTVVVPDVGGGGHPGRVEEVATSLLAGGGALLTVLTAAGTDPGVGERVRAAVAAAHPGVEVVVLGGGAPGSDVVLGVE